MHLIDGYDGGSAVYSRMHHSLAVARFALDCLIADIRHHRKARP